MTYKRPIFLAPVIFLLVLSAALWILWGLSGQSKRVLTYDEVLAQPPVRATYHSVNNWQTEEDSDFEGVPLYELLEKCGVTDQGAQIRVIAPDGYFWPQVGSVLELGDLSQANSLGLYTVLAYEYDGTELQPEPEGTGPLRLVMPQYVEGEINKPSWVSNVRLVEVGPLEEGFQAPDADAVPVDEVWVYGNVPEYHTFPLWPAATSTIIALLLLLTAALGCLGQGRRTSHARKAASLLVMLLLIAVSAGLFVHPYAQADDIKIFGMPDLKAMPAFSGHYTFLKSQPPYTYYEADYTGVPLSYLIEQAMTLSPNATGITVRARDNYKVNLSLQQIRKTYPGGLKVILAYAKGGQPLEGEEGPLRLIVPQETPGNKDQGGDANTPTCERMVFAVEVAPATVTPPATESVPSGSVAIYGAVSSPAAPKPPESVNPGSGEKKPEASVPATTTPDQPPATTQAPAENPMSPVDLLKSPPWGNLIVLFLVFGNARWAYSVPYLELQVRTSGKQ